ncbi:MAG: valine--tRNA ligase [Patescibacteria group bacterium]
MKKQFDPQKVEDKLYQMWREKGYFTPEIPEDKSKKPFSILLPPPNANDPLHIGHALYVVEDILCRYHRMLGDSTLFLPGTDHAGIETQFVYEQELQKKGQSRFDFDRKTLYKKIETYVEKNRGIATQQLRKLGFSLDWTREAYTMDPEILETVFDTFRKLHKDGLIYRGERLVNYCTQCGTAFSNLEINYVERKDPLYYLEYGPFTLATTRPETKFGDTAVAVHPEDARYKDLVGTKFTYQSLIGPREMQVIADKLVDPEFGTGAVKVTPAHDPNDFEMAQRHDLPIIKVINREGKLTEEAGRFAGLTVKEARKQVVEELKEKRELVKIEHNYKHRVATCYRCGTTIEPLLMPQWYVNTNSKFQITNDKLKENIGKEKTSLKELGIAAVEKGLLKIIPKRFKKIYLHWMENLEDWNISRQIVWGPRIPAWYCLECNPNIRLTFINSAGKEIADNYQNLKDNYTIKEIKEGLQQLTAPKDSSYFLEKGNCPHCNSNAVVQETDTFDTWFSSGQWPLTTLGYPDSRDFEYFYPTSVLDTMWDILFFWVARMVMLGVYRTGEVPFKVAHMHSRVVDEKGQKMSKSKGNVLNPSDIVEEYGADALRMALVFGASPGSDISLGDDKLRAMRNFGNKIWNATRFALAALKNTDEICVNPSQNLLKSVHHPDDIKIIEDLNKTIEKINDNLKNYRFDFAAENLYHFFWHTFCDEYIEKIKPRIYEKENEGAKTQRQALETLFHTLITSLKLLHPFMPFVTEEIWQKIKKEEENLNLSLEESITIAPWPEEK